MGTNRKGRGRPWQMVLGSGAVGMAMVGAACGGGGGSHAGGGSVTQYCAVIEKTYAAIRQAKAELPADADIGGEVVAQFNEYSRFADRIRQAAPERIADEVETYMSFNEKAARAGGIPTGELNDDVVGAERSVHDFDEEKCGVTLAEE